VNSLDEDVSTLTELGLTVTQAKIYLTLSKTKNLTAQEISKIAKVTRPDVYRILTQLQEAGIVEKIIATPTEFHAIPINVCIAALMEKRLQKTAQIAQKAKKLIQNFKPNSINNQDKEKQQFILLPEKPSIHDKAQQMLQNAQTQICFLMESKIIFPWFAIYLPIFKKALDRKVECRLITPQFSTNNHLKTLKTLIKYSNFSLRFISETPKAFFSLWDKKAVLIVTSPIGAQSQTPTLWSNNKSIVDLCQDYFENLWINAKNSTMSLDRLNDIEQIRNRVQT
jgi:sugar-specific transcriptional regulator TrmB